MENGKKIGFLRFKFLRFKPKLSILLALVLFSTLYFYLPLLRAAIPLSGSVVLQSNTKIQPSQMVDKELGRVYTNETVQLPASISGQVSGQTIEPFVDAKVLMKTNRNNMLDFEIKSMNWALYLQGLGDSSPEKEVFANHFGGFAAGSSSNESSGGTFNRQDDPVLQYADVNGGNFESFNFGPEQESAAKINANLIANPFPSASVSDPKLMAPEKLADPKVQKLFAQALAEQAILSMSRHAFSSAIAKRHPIDEISDQSSILKPGMSFMEMMENEAVKNFLNEAWQKQMRKNYQDAVKAGKTELAMSYERALRESYTNFVLYQSYRELEQIKLLLATMVAVLQQQAKAGAGVVSSATSGQAPSSR